MLKPFLLFAAAVCTAFATSAGATSASTPAVSPMSGFSVRDAYDPAITTSANHVVGAGLEFVHGRLALDVDDGYIATLKWTFLGRDAAWNNVFIAPGGSLEGTSFRGQWFSSTVEDSGLLDFGFRIGDGVGTWLDNRTTFAVGSARYGIALDRGGLSGLLLLDDGGGGPAPDRDYDDLMIRFDVGFAPRPVTPVPEASSLALCASGVAVLGLVARRRRTRV